MIRLIALFAAFVAVGLFLLNKKKAAAKDRAVFVAVTTLGAVLWGSLLMHRPLDVNKLIAAIMDRL